MEIIRGRTISRCREVPSLAGSVAARKSQRATTSDWMELEKKRGVSISSTVLQFDYNGYRLNLLDTPGHKDFSEDTYRVLTAMDSVVMVIDSAKGIEPQTRKLFEVCRQRGVPCFSKTSGRRITSPRPTNASHSPRCPYRRRGSKSEIRMTKSERSPKLEIQSSLLGVRQRFKLPRSDSAHAAHRRGCFRKWSSTHRA